MKPTSINDCFAILGIEPTASPEEIRKAYIEKVRGVHPDRFNFKTQTTVSGVLIGRNLISLVRWWRSRLKPAFFLTPLYLIKTAQDVVSFFPFWAIEDFSAVSRRRFFVIPGMDLRLKVESHLEVLRFSFKHALEFFENRFETYEKRVREDIEAGRFGYIIDHDDFYYARRRTMAAKRATNRWVEFSVFGLTMLASLLLLAVAIDRNMTGLQNRFASHPKPVTMPEAAPRSLQMTDVGRSNGELDKFAAVDLNSKSFDHSSEFSPVVPPPVGLSGQNQTGHDSRDDVLEDHPTTDRDPKRFWVPPGTSLDVVRVPSSKSPWDPTG